MSKSWEIDPETKAKLLEIQKQNGNNVCVDCNASYPQWASPKFGIFMCLECSGIHRGLGVHISFIRSVTMDGFKVAEVKRMQLAGNEPWQDFFNNHQQNKLEGKTFESATIKERYDSEVGEEWKERLSAKVEDREYVPGVMTTSTVPSNAGSRSATPAGRMRNSSNASPARTASPAATSRSATGQRKAQNEAYFAKLGQENANRPENLAPSQGGKYGGFRSQPMPERNNDNDMLGDLQKDPMAALTKGFGWLGKSAMTGYEGWVKPNVQKLAESDFTHQASQTAASIGRNIQAGSKSAADSFNRFVEGETSPTTGRRTTSGNAPMMDPDKREFWDSFGEARAGPPKDKVEFWDNFGQSPKGPPKDKVDFWDSFAEAGAQRQANLNPTGGGSSSVGTAAMKKPVKKDDDWDGW